MSGPLAGTRCVELGGVGPVAHCGMLLADLGADVILLERPGGRGANSGYNPVTFRGRRSVQVNLKDPRGRALALDLISDADIAFEGFRPGVAERLGIGPEEALEANAKLVYGRVTGWGQYGPLSEEPGHDINYLALTGALHAIGTADSGPVIPLNLLADYAGGSMYLLAGLLAGLNQARITGEGTVVDAAMIDGVSSLLALQRGLGSLGKWNDERHSNFLDGAAPYYCTYRCADGEFMAVGALEERFYAELLEGLGLSDRQDLQECRTDPDRWPAIRAVLERTFATESRLHWTQIFSGKEACVSPVLSLTEASHHPHMQARQVLVEAADGAWAPTAAPRFAGQERLVQKVPGPAGADTRSVLTELGLTEKNITELMDAGVVAETRVADDNC